MGSCYSKMSDYKNAKHFFEKALAEHRTPQTLDKLSQVRFQPPPQRSLFNETKL